MEKACIQNLALIVNEDCNLDCRHCLRGKKCQRCMSKEVIEETFNQVAYVHNLCLCGGEPLMNLEPIINIIDIILQKKIIVDQVSMVINGTIYKKEFIDMLYLLKNKLRDGVIINISYDKYHIEEIEKRHLKEAYLENLKRYADTPYFGGLRRLDPKLKLFNEGNATNLDPSLTIDLRPVGYAMTYIGNNKYKLDLNGYCYIGPLVTISVDGIITEGDASFENQKTKFNYGNVLTDSIVEVVKTKTPIYNPIIYRYKVKKIAYDFTHYNK